MKEMTENKKSEKKIHLTKYKGILFVVLAALLTEIFIFNFRTFQSLFYEEKSLLEGGYIAEGVTDYGNGYFVLEDGENCRLRFDNPGVTIRNLKVDIEVPTSIPLPYMETNVCKVTAHISDEGSRELYDVSSEGVVYDVPSSKYLWFNSMGDVSTVELELYLPSGYSVQVHDIKVNAFCPLQFSIARFFVVFVIYGLVYSFRKESVFWKENCLEWTGVKKISLTLLLLLCGYLGWFFISENASIAELRTVTPYQDLAQAFTAGQVSLLQEPSEELVQMENPYDYLARQYDEVEFLWDYAYYDGAYYVYFGVVPCVLFYFPFYATTGLNLPDEIPTLFCAMLFVLGCFMLLRQIVIKYFPKLPYGMLLLMSAVMGFGCQLPYFLVQPEGYNIPILMGMMFSVWGLYGWFAYLSKAGKERWAFLVAGAFCMALVFGCRPQIGLFSFLAIPMFLPWLLDKKIQGKEKMYWGLSVGIPYIIVAVPLMYYNAIRFGSVTDFGAMYNLTVFDMTQANGSVEKVFYGIFEYLFRLPSLDIFYPFVDWLPASHLYWEHLVFYSEPSLGGLFSCNLILFSIFFLGYVWKDMKDKKVQCFSVSLAVFSLIILIVDSEIVGAVYRYVADYSFALFLLCFLVLATIWEKVVNTRAERYFRHGFFLFCALSLAFNLLTFLTTGYKFPLVEGNTILYYELMNMFSFW